MSKKLINQDAAYALGEEAFRAGFRAALRAANIKASDDNVRAVIEQSAWDGYEPSEDVKALIGDES